VWNGYYQCSLLINLLFHKERCSISASEDILQDAAYLLCSWTHRIYANDGGYVYANDKCTWGIFVLINQTTLIEITYLRNVSLNGPHFYLRQNGHVKGSCIRTYEFLLEIILGALR